MILHSPFSIGSRLLPCLTIGGATVSLENTGRTDAYGKPRWQWYVDLADGTEHTDDDLCGWGDTQKMFGSLLSFLGACGEALRFQEHTGRESENADLFPAPVAQWARQNSDELSALQSEIEESGTELIEE